MNTGQTKLDTDAREESLALVRALRGAGFTAYWAGGCVRDLLMDRPPKDYDVATSATPDQVQALFPKTLDVGRKYGVIHVVCGSQAHEVTTFRRDAPYPDGRHPEAVAFGGPEEDARRRDFTINGLFLDPEDSRVLDYVGGQEDIRRRVVRTIGRPEDRFGEDFLRMLRAVRFASTLEFELDPEAAAAIRALAGRITQVSAERIQQELTRLLSDSPKAGRGLRLLRETGLLEVILPESARMHGQEQPPQFHPEGDVFEHTALMLDAMASGDVTLAWAVLLHDVGKPPTAAVTREPDGSERIRFHNHAEAGAAAAEEILRRLRMPTQMVEDVAHCVRNHMRFADVKNMRPATLRRLLGAPTFPAELELHRLDCLVSHGDLENYRFLVEFVEKLKSEPVLPPRWVTGAEVLALGVPQGPEVGRWLKAAYDAQLDGRFPDRDQLLAWLRAEMGK